MVFSSITFLFLFLPIVLCLYHVFFLPVTLGLWPGFWRRASNFFLLAASLLFYFWGETYLVWIIVSSTLINYVCGLMISGAWRGGEIRALTPGGSRSAVQKLGLTASIVSNLAFLGFFKYFNFGVGNYNQLASALSLSSLQWQDAMKVALPLGISFYTFQSMSYTIDVYRGQVKATRNFVDFACYVTLFPQLVAGPIVRYRDVAGQLLTRMVSVERFASGVSRFVFGLGKKVLLANTAAIAADKVFALPAADLSPGMAWMGALAYTLQIYFDFSGYSDMAIGLGRMFGFEYLENFNYPYVARSVQDFWRRWHISLSTWFRDYLYVPLGGSRKSAGRTYFNLVTVFLLCGLWHGASWTFVVWGLYHGVFLVIERLGLGRMLAGRNRLLVHLYTLLVVVVGWVLFRCETFSQAVSFLGAMAGVTGHSGLYPVARFFTAEVQIAMLAGAVLATPVFPWMVRNQRRLLVGDAGGLGPAVNLTLQGVRVVSLAAILAVSAMWLASGTHNPFIYFRF